MRNIIATSLVIAGLVLGTQAGFARNSHTPISNNHGSTTLALGDFDAECDSADTGVSSAEFRTIAVGNHNQLVAQLKARGESDANCRVENLGNSTVLMTAPINFVIVKGNSQWFSVTVAYLPHGASSPTFASFVTPDSKLIFDGTIPLIDNGSGNYSVPLAHNGGDGIPQGAQLVEVQFAVGGNRSNCDQKTIDLNHVSINGRFIGLDTTAAASFCGSECGGGGGAN